MTVLDAVKDVSSLFGAIIALITIIRFFTQKLRLNANAQFFEVHPYPEAAEEAIEFFRALQQVYITSLDELSEEAEKQLRHLQILNDKMMGLPPRTRAELPLPPLPPTLYDGSGAGPALERHYQWRFEIRNSGSREVKELILHAPFDGICTVELATSRRTEQFKKQVAIGGLRSRGVAVVTVWTDDYMLPEYATKDLYLDHSDGSVQVQVAMLLHGIKAKVARWFQSWGIPITLLFFAWIVLSLLVIYKPTSEPSVQSPSSTSRPVRGADGAH